MRTYRRILLTVTALAALSVLALSAPAGASPPVADDRGTQHSTNDRVGIPNSGHGAQFDRDEPAVPANTPATGEEPASTAGRGDQLDPVQAAALVGLVLTLVAYAAWRRRRPPREAI